MNVGLVDIAMDISIIRLGTMKGIVLGMTMKSL